MEELQVIQNILSVYEKASRQQINQGKTTLFFNKDVTEETKREILTFLKVSEIKEYIKYLGLPIVVGRKKKVKPKLHKGDSVEQTTRMEGKAPIPSQKRGFAKSGSPSYPYFCHELLQVAGGSL